MTKIIAPVSALLLSSAFLMLGHGLGLTLVPLRAEAETFSATSIGWIAAFFYVGYVVGGIFAPFLIVRAGHIRAFASMISLASAATLLHPLLLDPYSWAFARLITGFCIAGVYLTIESWLNEQADNTTRGLVMSAYTIVVYLSIMAGQVSMSWLETAGFQAFVISSIALSIAVIPVALTKSAQPAPIAVVRLRPKKLYETSPAAIISCILVGISTSAVLSLLPLYGSGVGITAGLIPIVAGAWMFGGLLLQYPLGRLSDKIDRRYMLIVGCIGSVIGAFVMTTLSIDNPYFVIVMVALLGGLVQPLYAIAAAHAYDYSDPADSVETASGILLAYGVGSIFGPIGASYLMDFYGPNGLMMTVMVVHLIMAAFLLFRLTARETLTTEEKSDYDLASAAPIGGVIAPELYEGEDDYVLVPEEYDLESDVDEDTGAELPFSDDEQNDGTD